MINGDSGSTTFWTAAPLDGQWHLITGTRSGDTFTFSVDGVAQATDTTAVGTVASTDPLRMGSSDATSSEYDGLLDDVRIYNRALSTADISELFALRGLTVTTTSDVVDGATTSVSDLLANQGADGFISLREAVTAVNNDTAGNWTIHVGAGTFNLAGQLTLTNDVTIMGDPSAGTILDGGGANRIFNIGSGHAATLSQLIIQDGSQASGSGGAINNLGTLNMTDVVVRNNAADSGTGGGLRNAGTAVITNSLFVGNSASSGSGGAIQNTAAGDITPDECHDQWKFRKRRWSGRFSECRYRIDDQRHNHQQQQWRIPIDERGVHGHQYDCLRQQRW